MSYYVKKTSLETKFLVVSVVSVFLIPVYFVLESPSICNIYNFIQSIWAYLIGHIPYALFVAVLWHMLQKNHQISKNRIGTIAIACIFATLIDGLSIFHNLNTEIIVRAYITTPIEIFLCFYIEKLFILISRKPNVIRKLANIVDTIILFYIYAIVAQCFISWIPGVNWEFLPLKLFWYIVGPYECIFDIFIPSVLGIGISPIFTIPMLCFAKKLLATYFEDILIELDRK